MIHQIWLGPKPLPLDWMSTWGGSNVWGEKDIEQFGLHNRALYEHCLSERMYDAAADIARVEILYRLGGVYADADTELLRPIPSFLHDFVAAEEPSINHPYLVTNAFMAATPGSVLLRQYITALSRQRPFDVSPRNCAELTGPGLLTKLLGLSRAPAIILPPSIFDRGMDGQPIFGALDTPYIRHHFSTTHEKWTSGRPANLASEGYPK